MTISMSTFRDDIDRAFRVLGAEKGFDQNATDIKAWKEEGYLTDQEACELKQYNRTQYGNLFIDEITAE